MIDFQLAQCDMKETKPKVIIFSLHCQDIQAHILLHDKNHLSCDVAVWWSCEHMIEWVLLEQMMICLYQGNQ